MSEFKPYLEETEAYKLHRDLINYEEENHQLKQQLQTITAKAERYEKALEEIKAYRAESSASGWDNATAKQMYLIAKQALGGE